MFIDKIINSGFKANGNHNQKNGWLGLTHQQPELWFTNGSKEVLLSLQGPAIPEPVKIDEYYFIGEHDCTKEEYENYMIMLNSGAVKYIRLKIGDKIYYQSYSGVVPSDNGA